MAISTIELMERGLMPDRIVRAGICRLIGRRLRNETRADGINPPGVRQQRLREMLAKGPIAVHTQRCQSTTP